MKIGQSAAKPYNKVVMMKRWYNNGEKEIQIEEGVEVPEGFIKGRKPEAEITKLRKSQNCWTHKASLERLKDRNSKISSTIQNKTQEQKDLINSKIRSAREQNYKYHEPWNKGKVGVQTAWNKGKKTGSNWTEQSAKKAFETRRKNNNLKNTDTQIEKEVYNILVKLFGKEDIYHPYRDDIRYPFNCDFYAKSLDLFIEINAHWTHGGHPFDENSEMDKKTLNEWKEKAKTSQFYKNAINTWTVRDVNKFKYARDNNLNYLYYYGESSTTIERLIREEISVLRIK